MSVLKRIVDFYFYGNWHISFAAVFFALETYLVLGLSVDLHYLSFVFCSTMCMYNMHRLQGLRMLDQKDYNFRFDQILTFKNLLILFIGITGVGTGYFGLRLKYAQQVYLIIPVILSILYVLPIFPESKRLRDYDYLKIFLIAIVWAWIAVIVPAIGSDLPTTPFVLLSMLFLERFLFILGITIPFDIRDLKIDDHKNLKTIPSSFGLSLSIKIAIGILLTSLLLFALASCFLEIPTSYLVLLIITYAISIIIIWGTKEDQKDLYYTGLLDGMILLRGLVLLLYTTLFTYCNYN